MTQLQIPDESPAEVLAWALTQIPEVDREQHFNPRDVLLAITGQAPLPTEESEGSISGILARVLSAPDLDTAILGQGTATIDRILGRPVSLDRPRWYASDYQGGSTCFTVIEAVDVDDGTVEALVVGSAQPQLVIWRAWVESRFPLVVKFEKSRKPTAAGYFPYNIVAV